jgi:threonine dehydrogenase-like Zn-dependent dehydrogenase
VVILKTTIRERSAVDLSAAVVGQITFVGSRSGPFPPVLRALAEGRLHVEDYVSRSFSLEDGVAALHAAAEKGARKIEIVMNDFSHPEL